MIIGIDFGAPRWAKDQRKKIIAVAAGHVGPRHYVVEAGGLNARLFARMGPGYAVSELLVLLREQRAHVVGCDFPFGVPLSLLQDTVFASDVQHAGAFGRWRAWNTHVAQLLPLTDPLDFAPFAAWRSPVDRARLWQKRATDVAAMAQPPLKDRFQATMQMTLVGNAVLASLVASGHYHVVPFSTGQGGALIEVYPAATLRAMGLRAYKAQPHLAVQCAVAASARANITVDIAPAVLQRACDYNSGGAACDHDVADAIVALCTAILYAEHAAQPAIDAATDRTTVEHEGAIFVPKFVS